MKLSQYAKQNDICYRTAWNRYKAGKINGAYQGLKWNYTCSCKR